MTFPLGSEDPQAFYRVYSSCALGNDPTAGHYVQTNEFQKQLVIQFETESGRGPSFDDVIALEDELQSALDPNVAGVDGHDSGSGETNIFIVTDEPDAAFKVIQLVLARQSLLPHAKVAYRSFDSDDYVVLWPQGTVVFEVR